MKKIKACFLLVFVISFLVACGDSTEVEDSNSALTASGTYQFNVSEMELTLNTTSSTFTANCGPGVGTSTLRIQYITETEMSWNGDEVWTRAGGTANNIVGTWSVTFSDGAAYKFIFEENGNYSLTATNTSCGTESNPDVIVPTIADNAITVDGDISDWGSISLAIDDPRGDATTNLYAGTDINGVYFAKTSTRLYAYIGVEDGTPASGTYWGIKFTRPDSTSEIGERFIFVSVNSNSANVDEWTASNNHSPVGSGEVAIFNGGIELSVSLADLRVTPGATFVSRVWNDPSGNSIDDTIRVNLKF